MAKHQKELGRTGYVSLHDCSFLGLIVVFLKCLWLLLAFFYDRDGAAVNFGVDKGVGVRMIRALGRPIVNHHCAGTLLFEEK